LYGLAIPVGTAVLGVLRDVSQLLSLSMLIIVTLYTFIAMFTSVSHCTGAMAVKVALRLNGTVSYVNLSE